MKILKILIPVALLATLVTGCTTVVAPAPAPGAQWNTPTLHCWVNAYGVQHCVPRYWYR